MRVGYEIQRTGCDWVGERRAWRGEAGRWRTRRITLPVSAGGRGDHQRGRRGRA